MTKTLEQAVVIGEGHRVKRRMALKKKKGPENKSSTHERIQLAAIGMEAEFAVVMDGVQVKPEDIFGTPRKIIREKMMHRKGRSYHLPTGGAVYFDTGVIEVATPVIVRTPLGISSI